MYWLELKAKIEIGASILGFIASIIYLIILMLERGDKK